MTTDRKKIQILLAAQQLFQERGLDEVTMEDVAKAAGKGKSTLYYYFRSKEEIFNAVFEMEMSEIILETIRQVNQQKGFLQKIQTFALVKFEMIKKRRSLYTAMESGMDAATLSRYTQMKKDVHKKYLQKEKVVMQQLLVEAIQNREIRDLDDAGLEESIYIFLAALRGMNREVFLHGENSDAYRMIPAFCSLYYRGLS
ncbi:TetR family transcriptional regulator [Chitinophaga caeni]|uniref:TetR family transcriptional regulator n=1 Tax=Chitinophaga caeni TaxID=2029983 RepID=A0A291QZK9_9BACT|nr:TetR/AcrR family transcriptional regulator [Chitinophaga caeni]ATL49365.1 TetR family transcriptional regulator [Chitinophaga caeni]